VNIEQKKQVVADLHEKLKKSKVVIVTDYKGLDVQTINALRRKLRDASVEYHVAKNSLIKRAASDTSVSAIDDFFKGPSALAISFDDPVAPAKVLSEFAKDNKKLEIRAGVMDGNVLTTDDIKALSSLPSREVLLAQLLSAMNGVPTGLVRALSDIPRRMLTVLSAINDQKDN